MSIFVQFTDNIPKTAFTGRWATPRWKRSHIITPVINYLFILAVDYLLVKKYYIKIEQYRIIPAGVLILA
ncbi:MAG: hypothetical protein KME40_04625 [Komarekiella atlantica HA4396-MV6]|nr:hypothetical protein [Komarekiella atlantica HA4396-MV6]